MVLKLRLQGSSMSMPAAIAWPASVAFGDAPFPPGMAHQSDITKPLKPKSVRKMSLSKCAFCVQLVPFTKL